MDVKEFAFTGPIVAPTQSELPDHKHVVLTCKDCGNTEIRPKVDPYSGHMFEQLVTYTCSICRGNMNLITEQEEK